MNRLFNTKDYRLFIKHRLSELKDKDRSLTYQKFAERAGFRSKGFLTQILQGKSNLSYDMALCFARALELNKAESEFFLNLVLANQAKNHSDRSASTEKLLKIKKKHIRTVEIEQFEYYKKWYYSAIRSLLGYYRFDGDYQKLGSVLSPSITGAQAKKAVDLLLKLGFIEKDESGSVKLKDLLISTGEDHQAVAVINYQLQTMDLAKIAVQELPREKRSAATLTLGVSASGHKQILEKVTQLRKELMDIAAADSGIDRVIQINIHAFPLTAESPPPLARAVQQEADAKKSTKSN